MTENAIPMMIEGQLVDRALADVLLQLGRNGATGILTIQGESDILALSFLQGEVVSTDSLNRTLEEGLGEVLEQEGWVSAEDYGSLASEYRAGGGRVLDLLVERSYLTERQLGLALRKHVYRLGLDAFRWRDGEFKFYAGDEVSYEECVRPISIEEFVVQATRDLGSMGPLDGGVASSQTVYAYAPDLPPIKDHNTLTPAEQWLMHELEEAKPVAQLIDRGTHSEHEVLFYLWRLERRGLLQGDGGGAAEEADAPEPVAPAPAAAPVQATPPRGSAIAVEDSVGLSETFDRGDRSSESPTVAQFPLPDNVPDVIELPRIDDEPEVISLGPIGESPLSAPAVEMPDPGVFEAERWGSVEDEFQAEKTMTMTLDLSRVVPWVARAVAGLGAALLLGGLIVGGDRTVLPFPWQSGAREDLARQRQTEALSRLDEGLRTYFLLNGSFPEDLAAVAAEGWVGEGDLVDLDGERFAYSPTSSTFVLQSGAAGSSDWIHQGGVTGNFLLDPDLAAFTDVAVAPLVLLD